MKGKTQREGPRDQLSELSDDDFYTTHYGRQVRRRRSVPDQKTSGTVFVSSWKLVFKSVRISGPNDFHPITVAMIKIDTSDVTNLLRENAHKIVNLVKDPERREKLFGIFELFRYSLHKMTSNLAEAQKKEFHEKMIERSMMEHKETQQPYILNKYTR